MESKKGENADMKESKGNISKKKINIKDIISNNKEKQTKKTKKKSETWNIQSGELLRVFYCNSGSGKPTDSGTAIEIQ